MRHVRRWTVTLTYAILVAAPFLVGTEESSATGDCTRLSPRAFLESHDAVVRGLLAQSPGDSLSPELRAQIKARINAAFDFEELSRLSLGSHWEQRTEEERREFALTFGNIIREQNLDRFVSYYREGQIDYQVEQVDGLGTAALVSARVTFGDKEEIEIEYRLHLVDGHWRVYDLVIDGASTAEGHWGRHARYIKKHSYEKLIQRLKTQLEGLTGRAK